MSKYINALLTARPEHLYVFNLDRAALNAGVVSDKGYSPVNASVVESVSAPIDVKPGLVYGERLANHPRVIHDRSGTGAESYFEVAGINNDYFGADQHEEWTIESVLYVHDYNRSENYDSVPSLTAPAFEILPLYTADGVKFYVVASFPEQQDVTLVETDAYPVNSRYQLVLVKSGRNYSLTVNGTRAGSGTVDSDYTYQDLVPNLQIGGAPFDAVWQSYAMFDYAMNGTDIVTHYEALDHLSEFETALQGDVVYVPAPAGHAFEEPQFESIMTGADAADFYEDANEVLQIQPSELAAAVTKTKSYELDLTELSQGLTIELETTTTTDANSSIVVEYSLDDVSWSAFADGTDTISELDAKWGGAV